MSRDYRGGFALPTVVITSIIMMTVVLAALSLLSIVHASLKGQYYTQAARNAAESGLIHAKNCISKTADNQPTWGDPNRLYTGTPCSGAPSPCGNGGCYVIDESKIKSYYSVRVRHYDNLSVKLIAEGVACTKKLDGSCGKQYKETIALDLVADVGPFWQISAGYSQTCAVSLDKKAYCWGGNSRGQLGNDSSSDSSTPVAVSDAGVLSGKPIKQISAGWWHSCVIAFDGKAYCWGYNNRGQLGNGSNSNSNVPVAVNDSGVLSGKTIKQISAGREHICAIAFDGKAYCWGSNDRGQLGNGSNSNSNVPVAVNDSGVLSGKDIKQISAGSYHTCAVTSDNKAYCWGASFTGQLGNGSSSNSNVPVAVNDSGVLSGKDIRQISAGNYHTCAAASDNKAYCWGANSNGQLGNGSTAYSVKLPVAVNDTGVLSGKAIKRVFAGMYNVTCAMDSDKKVYCWGKNEYGVFGNGSRDSYKVPVDAYNAGDISSKEIVQVSVGGVHACVIASNYKAYCAGRSYGGLLGNGFSGDKVEDSAVAVKNTTSTLASATIRARSLSVAQGLLHSCAIATNDRAYCWGRGTYGQLGNGLDDNSDIPVPVRTIGDMAGKTIEQISAAGYHTCAIASDNQAYCWGYNYAGQLGNGSSGNAGKKNIPTAVKTDGALAGKTIKQISVGEYHTCALASDNKAYCWGANNYGQLGINSTASSSFPVAVYTTGYLYGKTIKQISAGSRTTCVVTSDGQAYCWGRGDSGQLGRGSTSHSNVPVPVNTGGALYGKTIKYISAADRHVCAIASNNRAYCWGNNYNGQLGRGSNASSNVPVAVTTSGALSGKTIQWMASSGYNTCVVASDNQAYCWGYNYNGQLGNDSAAAKSNAPVAVDTSGVLSGQYIIQITSGGSHTCALASDNQIYCWGKNSDGQLGNEAPSDTNTPTVKTRIKMSIEDYRPYYY